MLVPAWLRKVDQKRLFGEALFHRKTLWDHENRVEGYKTVFLELREDDRVVEVDYTFKRVKGKQPIGERFIIGRKGATRDECKTDLMTIRTEYPYQTLRFWTAGSEEPALDLWNVYIPRDKEQRTNHTYGLMMVRKPAKSTRCTSVIS